MKRFGVDTTPAYYREETESMTMSSDPTGTNIKGEASDADRVAAASVGPVLVVRRDDESTITEP